MLLSLKIRHLNHSKISEYFYLILLNNIIKETNNQNKIVIVGQSFFPILHDYKFHHYKLTHINNSHHQKKTVAFHFNLNHLLLNDETLLSYRLFNYNIIGLVLLMIYCQIVFYKYISLNVFKKLSKSHTL